MDDVVVVVKTKKDGDALEKIVEEYEFIGGAKMNWNKCETMVVNDREPGGRQLDESPLG